MAKETLASTVDEKDIVDLGEVGTVNYMIDENYAITGDEYDYALVEKKVAYKTGKKEDGVNEGKVIKYTTWQTVKTHIYSNTPFGVLENYAKYIVGNKFKKLNRSNNFDDVRQIYLDTQATIRKALESSQFTDDINQKGKLVDEIVELKAELKKVRAILKEADELHELVKAKRKIVIDDTEPKKPKFKKAKEEEEVEDVGGY